MDARHRHYAPLERDIDWYEMRRLLLSNRVVVQSVVQSGPVPS